MELWCCQCQRNVTARLTSGTETYPHRPDLADLTRWICDTCKNHVGTHHKTTTPTKPLGNIPSLEVKKARILIHALIDPAWQSGKVPRKKLYDKLSQRLGYQYHTGEIKTLEEARRVYRVANSIINESMGE